MTLPTTGPISFSDINTEKGYVTTSTISLNDTVVRTLAAKVSGAISMQDLRGKIDRNVINIALATAANNVNLYTLAVANGYVAGLSDIILTINSGVVIGSTTTGPALTVSGFTTGDTVRINNAGYILGKGGTGCSGGVGLTAGIAAEAGGTALSLSFLTSINNTNIIGGGGGGGGAGGRYFWDNALSKSVPVVYSSLGGGGGGGGGGALAGNGGALGFTSSSIPGGGVLTIGTNGSAGSTTSGGAGGLGSSYYDPLYGSKYSGAGGAGGSLGASGAAGAAGTGTNQAGSAGESGAAGGNYIAGNSFANWLATGTRYGGAV